MNCERLVTLPDRLPRLRVSFRLTLAKVLIASDAAGERERIESSLAEAAGIAERMGEPDLMALVSTDRAELARALGDPSGWERELREALRLYTALGATGYVERITQELAS